MQICKCNKKFKNEFISTTWERKKLATEKAEICSFCYCRAQKNELKGKLYVFPTLRRKICRFPLRYYFKSFFFHRILLSLESKRRAVTKKVLAKHLESGVDKAYQWRHPRNDSADYVLRNSFSLFRNCGFSATQNFFPLFPNATNFATEKRKNCSLAFATRIYTFVGLCN